MVAAGQVYLPDPQAFPDATWVPWFLVDTATFPRCKARDLVDALSRLLNYLRRGGDYAGLRQFYRMQKEEALKRQQRLCMRCTKPILDNVPFSCGGLGAYHAPRCRLSGRSGGVQWAMTASRSDHRYPSSATCPAPNVLRFRSSPVLLLPRPTAAKLQSRQRNCRLHSELAGLSHSMKVPQEHRCTCEES